MRSRPWTAADAVSHNAALKGKAKLAKLWADTANGTLQSELEKKTSRTKAEGIADDVRVVPERRHSLR
jgi:hypothetical protein